MCPKVVGFAWPVPAKVKLDALLLELEVFLDYQEEKGLVLTAEGPTRMSLPRGNWPNRYPLVEVLVEVLDDELGVNW